MMLRPHRWSFPAALLVASVACEEEAAPVEWEPLEVLVGCAAHHGPPGRPEASTCLHDGQLRLWVAGAAPEVSIDGEVVTPSVEPVDGGHRLTVELAPKAGQLVATRAHQRWATALRSPTAHAALERIGTERTEATLLALQQASASAEGAELAALLSQAGRVALSLGQDELALRHLRRARELHRELGEWSEAVLDAVASGWVLQRRQWRFAEARAVLAAVDDLAPLAPIPAARALHRRAMIDAETGHLGAAERGFERAARAGRRLGEDQLRAQAELQRGATLHRLGRIHEAERVLAAGERGTGGCLPADYGVTRTWLALLDGRPPTVAALTDLERRYEACGAPVEDRANAALNTALGAALRDELPAARAALERAEQGGALVAAWELELDARLALRAGDASAAERAYAEMARRASVAGALGEQWRAVVGRGEALQRLGRRSEAREAYREAEAILDREARALSVGAAPGFVGRRWTSAARLAERLLADGRAAEAASVLRAARRRALGSSPRPIVGPAVEAVARARHALEADASTAWELSVEELSALEERREARLEALYDAIEDAHRDEPLAPPAPPGPGELVVVAFPHPAGRVVVALDDEGAEGAVVGEDQWPPFLSQRAEGHRSVRVIGAGAHAFAWPPVSAPVIHSLDLGRPRSRRAEGSVLVVVDPSGNLRGARSEGDTLAERFSATVLAGERATLAAVVEGSASVELFYYAGHGQSDEGLASGLRLATGELTAADVLARPAAPPSVVLNGCETGDGSGLVPVGVAQAFVLAGSDRVLAAIAPVSDAGAESVAELVANASLDGGGWARALAEARGDEERGSALDAFRIFVP